MRKRVVTDVRVEIRPDLGQYYRLFNRGDVEERIKDLEKEAESIIQQVRRHVDGGKDVGMVHDYEEVCGYCGSRWTEESDTYNGGCCDKDEENNQNSQPESKNE